ncbi:hypothetical protein KSP40_PGU009795 [Platanthera guangdongensis]|uniref:DUF4378 domain-containing protein n=1 Tax=Platanthera guangdongensis TaxID=2320717 RepID=A0ABR2MQH1_9ASPA
MGKKDREGSSVSEKENVSCLWRLVNIFQLGESYGPRKLLEDRKQWRGGHPGINLGVNGLEHTSAGKYEHDANDVDISGVMPAHSHLPNIKALIDEEMSKERTSKSSSYNFKLDQKTTKNNKNDSDPLISNLLDSAQVVMEQLTCKEPVECSNFIFDLAALMIEFYSVSRHCPDMYAEKDFDLCTPSRSSGHKKHIKFDESDSHLDNGRSMLREALIVEAEVFLSKKIDDAKRLAGDGVIHSQEFMDALEILNSNKELFVRLIQDSNSLVFKHSQEFLKQRITDFSKLEVDQCLEEMAHFEDKFDDSGRNGKSCSNQMFWKQKVQYFSKKDRCKGKTASKIHNALEELSRIVVLKPLLSRNYGDAAIESPYSSAQPTDTNKYEKNTDKFVSYFSFREIKRKLRHIIGESRKEQALTFSDGLLNRTPLSCNASTNAYRMTSTENSIKSFPEKTECRAENTGQSSLASLFHGESFSKETDGHFVEKLFTDYRTNNSTNNKESNSLAKLLSSSDNLCSPKYSSHVVRDQTLSPYEMISSPELHSVCDTPILKGTVETSFDLDVEMIPINSVAANDIVEMKDETCDGKFNTKGRSEIVKLENIKSISTNPAEQNIDTENSFSCERFEEEEGFSTPSEQDTRNEKPRIVITSASTPPSSLIINEHVSSEFIVDKPDRPSPVSVLEPFFIEDDASPDHPSIKAELLMPLQPNYLNNREDSAIVITTSDYSIPHQRCCSSELLPRSSVFDEIKALNLYGEDPKLISDCVNEAFLERNDRQFQTYPCAYVLKSTVRPPILTEDLIIQEVCKAIESYLSSQFQCTLNDIMRKDMGCTKWMDLRLQMEWIIAEIGCSIFDELMEETIVELPL